jgi:hypothetical protein
MGRLDVRVCGARNLPDTQWVSKPDPYVKCRLESQVHKTAVIENNLTPEWNEVFKFHVRDADSAQLRLEVWNDNVASDELLGHYTMSLAGLVQGEVVDKWFILQQCKSNAEIHVRVCAMDFGKLPTGGHQSPQQRPPQQQGGGAYPQASGAYPPPQGQYPPPPQQQGGAYPPPQGQYPPPQGQYPPPQHGGYPPPQHGGYPPPQQQYPPPQQQYPPPQQQYPPPQQQYPPQQPQWGQQQQGGYPGYPPPQQQPPQQGGYPGYPPPQQQGGYSGNSYY